MSEPVIWRAWAMPSAATFSIAPISALLDRWLTDDAQHLLLKPGGIAISCGWNSAGFGKSRGYLVLEIGMVAHGGAHNDTIVVVERKSERSRG